MLISVGRHHHAVCAKSLFKMIEMHGAMSVIGHTRRERNNRGMVRKGFGSNSMISCRCRRMQRNDQKDGKGIRV